MTRDIWIAAASVTSIAPSASFGYYEARFRASDLSTTSSFWLKGAHDEIDVVEDVGNSITVRDSAHKVWSSTHYFPDRPRQSVGTTTAEIPTQTPVTGWHVYGMWWKDSRTVCFYLDGVMVSQQHMATEFTEPLYLIFDTEAFVWQGLPSIAALGDPRRDDMDVDWVHAWRLVSD